jgi:signal transduction histidine kinase
MLLGTGICLAIGVGASFASHIFEFRRALPHLNRVYLTVVWSVVFVSTMLVITDHYDIGLRTVQMMTLVSIAVLTVVPIYLGARGQKAAWFYLFAFGIFNATVIFRFLRNLGYIQTEFPIDASMQIGTILHLLVMGFAIVWHYRKVQQEKNQIEMRLENELSSNVQQREFMNLVSHEFRTPLAIIDATTHMLRENLGDEKDRPKRYAKIERATNRLQGLLDNYLSHERFESMESEFKPKASRLESLAHSVVDEVGAGDGGLLQLHMHNLPEHFLCDPELLRIALRNLLENAHRYSHPYGIVSINFEGEEDGSVTIRVSDQGEGIAPDELPKIFDRFYRGRNVQGKPGAGLGLHLVRRIVMLHGGSVSVESKPGEGCTFIIRLPPGKS